MPEGLPQTVTFRDAKGFAANIRVYVQNDGIPANERTRGSDFATAVALLTNAALERAKGPYTTVPSPPAYGTQDVFGSIEDKAVLTFVDADGGLHRMQVPAPKVSIFKADQETVDTANTDVAALITLVLAELKTRDGIGFISMPAGLRQRRKQRRKASIFSLDPDETGPEE